MGKFNEKLIQEYILKKINNSEILSELQSDKSFMLKVIELTGNVDYIKKCNINLRANNEFISDVKKIVSNEPLKYMRVCALEKELNQEYKIKYKIGYEGKINKPVLDRSFDEKYEELLLLKSMLEKLGIEDNEIKEISKDYYESDVYKQYVALLMVNDFMKYKKDKRGKVRCLKDSSH